MVVRRNSCLRSKSRLIRLITGSGEERSRFGTDSLESHNVLVAEAVVEAVDDVAVLHGLAPENEDRVRSLDSVTRINSVNT